MNPLKGPRGQLLSSLSSGPSPTAVPRWAATGGGFRFRVEDLRGFYSEPRKVGTWFLED